jgi:hypothetical protein
MEIEKGRMPKSASAVVTGAAYEPPESEVAKSGFT